jgi:predicted dehydrogenase
VAEAGVKTIVSFCLHWNPSLVNTKTSLTGALSAHPTISNSTTGTISFRPTRSTSGPSHEHGRSTLLSAGCHAVDALRWFKGNDVAVTEVTALSVPHQGDNPDWGYDPTTVFPVPFADGTVGKVSSILDCEMPYQFNVDIVGTKGTIRGNRVWSTELFPGQTDWAVVPASCPTAATSPTTRSAARWMRSWPASWTTRPSCPTSTTPSERTKSSSPPTAPPPPASPYDLPLES